MLLEEEEIEYYEEDDEEQEEEPCTLDQLKKEELRKLRHLLRQNKEIPKLIII